MAVYKSKGIVLRSIRFGEADRILDLYTHDAGLVSAIAKGIRRTKSRIGGRLEPLSCVEFMAYRGRSLDTITQVEVLRSFHKVRGNLVRFEVAARIAGAVRAFSGGDEGDRRVFNLLYRTLEELESRESGFEAVEAAFKLKLSMLAGFAPHLESCIGCGAEPEASPDGHVYFGPEVGGVLCEGCRSEVRDAFPVPPGTVERLLTLARRPVREADLEARLAEIVRRVIGSHIQAHAPGAPAAPRASTRRRPA